MANVSQYTNPRYINSNQSTPLPVGSIAAPTNFVRTANVLSWSASAFAQFYQLYDNDVLVSVTPQTQYVMGEQTVGTHNYKVRAFRVDDNNQEYYSVFTDTITFTVTKLSAPVIHFNTDTYELYWNSVTDAQFYDLYVGGRFYQTYEQAYTSAEPLVIPIENAGSYSFKLRARNADTFIYQTSDESNTLMYTIYKLGTPSVTYTADPATITWSAITDANIYDIYVNGSLYTSTGLTTYVLNLGQGNFSIYVVARKQGQITHANPLYLNSDRSNSIEFGILGTPVISIDDNIVSWDPIENAEQYEIYNYGELLITISDTRYELIASNPTSFSIRVKAIGGGNLTDSDLSNTITYYITRLASPEIAVIDTTVYWNGILNADYYEIYVNNTLRYTTTSTTFAMDLYAGYNSIYVIAKSNQYRFLDSLESNIYKVTVTPDSATFIKVFDKTIKDYVAYPLIYPFSFNETIDETLDIANVITAPTDYKDPFEAYTNASVYIYSGETPVEGFPKHMLISKDDVEEIQIGESQKYKHNITLIERTKLLETELLPNLSITQPLEYVLWDNTPDSNKHALDADTGNYKFISSTDRFGLEDWSQSLPEMLGITEWYEWVLFVAAMVVAVPGTLGGASALFLERINYHSSATGPHASDITGELLKSYDKATISKISLPIENGLSYYTQVKVTSQMSTEWWGHLVDFLVGGAAAVAIDKFLLEDFISGTYDINSLNDMGVRLCRKWYYRSHTTSYAYDPAYPETLIATKYDNTAPTWNISAVPNGVYDIIMEIEPVAVSNLYNIVWRIDGSTRRYNGSLSQYNFMVDKDAVLSTNTILPENKMHKYRVVWGSNIDGIIISQTSTILDQSSIEPEHKTLEDAFDKVLDAVQPLSYKTGVLDSRKYELDPVIRRLSRDIACPELVFTGTKSLYEVLQTFGRLFYGVPRLGLKGESNPTNTITYDVINVGKLAEQNPNFDDANTKEEIISTIDNHTTGYVSDLKNVVTNNYWSVYPSGDAYINARSSSSTDVSVTLSSMSIVVDKPIYKLVDVWLTNFDNDNPNRIISLKNVIYEKTLFNSLNNNAAGKGSALYYTQGDNRIMGLGQLPEANEFYSTIGFSPDEYVIEHILKNVLGYVDIKAPRDYKYKVFYTPVNDIKVYTEQANVSGLSNNTYKVLNQEDNVINDDNFGHSAQTQIERLGNNSIIKPFRVYDYDELPYLGQVKEYDGYKYYADNITISYNMNYIDAVVSFSKNFNKINERVGVNSLYRLYQIADTNIVDRTLSLNNYCYISTQAYTGETASIDTLKNTNYRLVTQIKNAFNNGSNKSNPSIKPDTFYIRNLNPDGSRLKYLDYYGNVLNVPSSVIPVSCNTFKTSICFSGKMYDNFSAGVSTPVAYNDKATQMDVRYVNSSGENSIMGITLCRPTESELKMTSTEFNEKYNSSIFPGSSFTNTVERTYPEVAFKNAPKDSLSNVLHSEKYLINKDNKECMNITYQLHFLTYDKNIFIHKGIVSRLFKNLEPNEASDTLYSAPKYILYKGDVNKQDYMQGGSVVQVIGFPTLTQTNNIVKISRSGAVANGDYDGIALIWYDNEIIYTYNKSIHRGDSVTIPDMYLNFFDDKIDYKLS